MNRTFTVAMVMALVLTGCTASPGTIEVTGTVTDQAKPVGVPAIGSTVLVTNTPVALGSHVAVGQTLVQLDEATLTARVRLAQTSVDVTRAQVGKVESALDTLTSRRSDLSQARTTISKAIAQLSDKEKQLATNQRQLIALHNTLIDRLAQVDAALNTPGLPPSEVARLKAIAGTLRAQIATIDTALAKIGKAAPQLASGLKTARAHQATLATASATLTDARAQLRRLEKLARIAADTAPIDVELAQLQRNQATVTAPITGTVVAIALVGDRLAPGATVATIRPDGPSQVTAWLAPDQIAIVCVGDHASMHGDWMAPQDSATATVSWISPTADFPPSNTATKETHLMRATQVTLTSDTRLPAGTGIDMTISGCHPAAGQGTQDR